MQEFFLNADGSFMSEEQIVEDILNKRIEGEMREIIRHAFNPPLTDEEKDALHRTGLNLYTHMRITFGRWIRNSYGLWDQNNPYSTPDGAAGPNSEEFPCHPDDKSGRIIDELIKRVQVEHKETVDG